MKAIYPGSFDPITNGHIDVIERASNFFDEIIVATLCNSNKKYLFSSEERKKLIDIALSHHSKISVVSFEGLLIDYMKDQNIKAIVKGLRTVTDYGYEAQMALTNKKLYEEAETFFMHSQEKYSFLSSSLVKEVYSHKGDLLEYVPDNVDKALKELYGMT
ncbi:pantetheine-phosphate adenylyltransferase [Salinicoccus albus]|uniref:pantetheine-phosphate adenylyltransferase n=1 Tax=Salinicoccus albus TaxID=418756 RepID=UPI0003672C8D|nr:pantetheine-phosphate adenylyltransferase [Salinicoccus albus]